MENKYENIPEENNFYEGPSDDELSQIEDEFDDY